MPRGTPHFAIALLLGLLCACGDASSAEDSVDVDVLDPLDDAETPSDTADAASEDTATDTTTTTPLRTAEELMALVDPFVGTGGLGFGFAALTPAAQRPLSWTRLGPDTTQNGSHPELTHFGGYYVDDPDVRGFSHTHFVGTGVADYGNVRVLPLTATNDTEPWRRFVGHNREAEQAAPGLYETALTNGVQVALTTDHWLGAHRYTYPAGPALLQLDLASSVTDSGVQSADLRIVEGGVEGSVTYRGSYVGRQNPFTLYVSARIDAGDGAPVGAATPTLWDASGMLDANITNVSDTQLGVVWDFGESDDVRVIHLRVGLSLVDPANAATHRELASGFDELAAESSAEWRTVLSSASIATDDDQTAAIFATALYNTQRMPSRLSEWDGRYRGVDGEVHTTDATYYSDLSLWDTFRTVHPWYALTAPAVQADCLNSLLAMASQSGGRMPRWPAALSLTNGMIGSPADQLFGGSAAKGVAGVDYDAALDVLWDAHYGRTLTPPTANGRDEIESYVQYGYLPSDQHDEPASRTLEYAWADEGLASLARVVGDEARETIAADAAGNWANLFDPETGFLLPRRADGTFEPDVRPRTIDMRSGWFTEGSSWHWRFYAPHQPAELAQALGPQTLHDALTTLFERSALGDAGPVPTLFPDPYYWHGNEPALHIPYLWRYAGDAERLGFWMRQIQTRLYSLEPDGLPGNDDGGTLSAWYLFSVIGLHPIAGTDRYILGAPLVPEAVLQLGGGSTLTVQAPGAGADRWHVTSVTLNGEPVEQNEVQHRDLVDGVLHFTFSEDEAL